MTIRRESFVDWGESLSCSLKALLWSVHDTLFEKFTTSFGVAKHTFASNQALTFFFKSQ
jgi:hypothetical protein